jgi:hypothetical protein
MDLDKAVRLEKHRTYVIEELNRPLTPEDAEDNRTLSERYQSIIERVAVLVDRDADVDPVSPERQSKFMFIMRASGILPNVSLRFRYYSTPSDSPNYGEFSFTNQFDERIVGVEAEWAHTPDGEFSMPTHMTTDKAVSRTGKLTYGEIFAEESVNDPHQRFHMVASRHRFTLIEQSLDAYEAALRNETHQEIS